MVNTITALFPQPVHYIANACKILHRVFATVGIIALVDEATGYMEDLFRALGKEDRSREQRLTIRP